MPRPGSLGYVPAVMDEHEAFTNFIEGMKVAESAARQLAFVKHQPQWIQVASLVGTVRDRAIALAVRKLAS